MLFSRELEKLQQAAAGRHLCRLVAGLVVGEGPAGMESKEGSFCNEELEKVAHLCPGGLGAGGLVGLQAHGQGGAEPLAGGVPDGFSGGGFGGFHGLGSWVGPTPSLSGLRS